MPIRPLRLVELVAIPVGAVAVAVGAGEIDAPLRPDFFVEIGQDQLDFRDRLARRQRRGDLLRRIGKTHQEAAVDGIEGQRPGLGAAPDRRLAAILDHAVFQQPLAVGGHGNWPIPMRAKTAHAGGFRLVQHKGFLGDRMADDKQHNQRQEDSHGQKVPLR